MRTIAVILNYQTPGDTILAVRSLQADDKAVDAIVVVDNASSDGSIEAFRKHLTDVEIVECVRNDGFSAGCNAGIAWALEHGATHVLLLNSDVIAPPGTVSALLAALAGDRRIGIVAPEVRFRNNPDLVESRGVSYDASSGRMRMIAHGQRRQNLAAFDCCLVDGVSGCAMLIRREVLEAVGPLRNEYFFGFEDLDFCCRARRLGFLIACVGSASVLHEGSRSIGRRSPQRAYLATRNHLLLASRFPPGSSRLRRTARLMYVLFLNLAHVLTAPDIPLVSGMLASARGTRDFVRGRFGPPA
jgi:GT2 family glycosyltransferase